MIKLKFKSGKKRKKRLQHKHNICIKTLGTALERVYEIRDDICRHFFSNCASSFILSAPNTSQIATSRIWTDKQLPCGVE